MDEVILGRPDITPILHLCRLYDRARVAEQISDDVHAKLWELKARNKELEEVLAWYGENARLCRLIHSEGDPGRWALSADGGKKARDILEKS